MITLAAAVMIDRSADEVFGFLANLDNLTVWQDNVIDVQVTTPGPIRVGTEYVQTLKMGPTTIEGRCRITQLDPGQLFGFNLASKVLDCTGELRLDPVPGGTRLTSTGSGQLHGVWRVMTPVFQAQVKREAQVEVNRIKTAVESGAPTVA